MGLEDKFSDKEFTVDDEGNYVELVNEPGYSKKAIYLGIGGFIFGFSMGSGYDYYGEPFYGIFNTVALNWLIPFISLRLGTSPKISTKKATKLSSICMGCAALGYYTTKLMRAYFSP